MDGGVINHIFDLSEGEEEALGNQHRSLAMRRGYFLSLDPNPRGLEISFGECHLGDIDIPLFA